MSVKRNNKMSLSRYLIKSKSNLRVQLARRRRSLKSFFAFFGLMLMFCLFVAFITFEFIQQNNDPLAITQNFIYLEPLNSYYREHHVLSYKIDYHDYEYLEREKLQFGLPGENGQPVYAEAEEEALNKKLFDENGYYGLISDKIALNRSLPDFRHEKCKEMKYAEDLPSVSVVIPFFNDHLSTLLRTIYSVINRAPKHLLKEVILVNDHSTKEFLYKDLEDHLRSHKHLKIVKLLVLPRRSGLIWARLAGARAATGDILLFLDSHTEASVNYLPPLIEPIAKDYRTCVCPMIDAIEFQTFRYTVSGEGSRGVFDWRLAFQYLPVRPTDRKNAWDNFEEPVMVGGLFAISSKFFWELGGYDTGLDIWGGEQFELSFKIWLCGGKMYNAPCSRIGHVFRGSSPFPNDRKGIDFVSINLKRVAEVWMDEFKEFVYKHSPESIAKADAGDLTYQFAIKEQLQCKPFSYFMERVAPDLLERYPYVEPPEFASGAIQSMADTKYCIDRLNRPSSQPIGVYVCAKDKINPQGNQNFVLRYYRDVSARSASKCLDSYGGFKNVNGQPRKDVKTGGCHQSQGNQYFRYDLDTMQLYHGPVRSNNCVEVEIATQSVFVTPCNKTRVEQQWKFGFTNETAIRNWLNYGAAILDKQEILDLEKLLQ